MTTSISGSTGIDKVQDGTIVSADLDSGLALGKVLQVVHSSIRTSASDSASTSYTEISTDYRVTITPASTSNTILLNFQCHTGLNAGTHMGMRFMVSTDSGSNWTSILPATNNGETFRNHSSNYDTNSQVVSHKHSPNTTSSIMYTMFFARTTGSSTCRINDNGMGSYLTATEIGA